jgi:hypothetical protein
MKRKIIIFLLAIAIAGGFFWLKAKNYNISAIANCRLEPTIPPTDYATIGDIPPPEGFVRTTAANTSFAAYLRSLPLKKGHPKVYMYNGQEKRNQNAHWAVVDIDTGDKDLQQCADATMRLWAEYLYKYKRYNEIKFNFLSDGKPRYYKDYAEGDYSYPTFRKYLEWIFSYANTASLYHELKTVAVNDLQPGDLFIFKGVPLGHAVIVVDMSVNPKSGERLFMLVQGWIPAQDMHLLKNPNDGKLSPWYSTNFGDALTTPEFVFDQSNGYKIKRYGK